MAKIIISVYLDDGRVYEYEVDNQASAREHLFAIVSTGYRSSQNNGSTLTHYPPHRITKVKATGDGVTTSYPDTVRGT